MLKRLFSFLFILLFSLSLFGETKKASMKEIGERKKRIKRILIEVRRGKTGEKQASALEPLRKEDHVDSVELIISLVRNSRTNPVLAKRGSEIMGTYKSEEVREYLKSYMKKHPLPNLYVLEAVSYMAIPGLEPAFLKIVKEKSKKPIAVAQSIRALGRYDNIPESTIKLLTEKLDPKHYHAIRRFAVESLMNTKNRSVPPLLIDKLDDIFLGKYCDDALRRLTKQNFGRDKKAWSEWWKENGAECDLALMPLKEFLALKAEDENPDEDREKEYASFYGLRVEGKNILFILDRSGSMNQAVSERTRMDIMKEQFTEMLDELGSNVSIGIVFFELCSNPFRKKVSIVDEKFKKKCKRHMKMMTAGGRTPLMSSLRYSFEKLVSKENIDTIYLLSDGEPTDTTAEKCLETLQEWNNHLYVTINTISIGQESDLLYNIAKDHSGEYRSVLE